MTIEMKRGDQPSQLATAYIGGQLQDMSDTGWTCTHKILRTESRVPVSAQQVTTVTKVVNGKHQFIPSIAKSDSDLLKTYQDFAYFTWCITVANQTMDPPYESTTETLLAVRDEVEA